MLQVDPLAKFEVTKKFVLPEQLHLPIAAKNVKVLSDYVGEIQCDLSPVGTNQAFLISVPNTVIPDPNLEIWHQSRSHILNSQLQVWVHVNYKSYRRDYIKALPEDKIQDFVLDHILNRRIARLKGYNYLRIIPVSKGVNSSSSYSEKWGVDLNSRPEMIEKYKISKQKIQYADLCDIVKMLNIKPGGGFMEEVNYFNSLLKNYHPEK